MAAGFTSRNLINDGRAQYGVKTRFSQRHGRSYKKHLIFERPSSSMKRQAHI